MSEQGIELESYRSNCNKDVTFVNMESQQSSLSLTANKSRIIPMSEVAPVTHPLPSAEDRIQAMTSILIFGGMVGMMTGMIVAYIVFRIGCGE